MSRIKKNFLEFLPVLILTLCLLLGFVFSIETRVTTIPGGIQYERIINIFRFSLFIFGGILSFGCLKLIIKKRDV